MNSENYHMGEPFIVTVYQNITTGYSWKFQKSDNLQIVTKTSWNTCEPGISGCGGYLSLVLIGTQKGPATLEGEYSRSWEPSSASYKKFKFMII